MSDNAVFKKNFAALLKRAGDKVDTVVRKTALELQSELIRRSPVDTGRFRSNWNCGLGTINTITTDSVDKEGSGTLARTQATLGSWKPGDMIYLTNSLPYARPLEYGHSKQAPSGMVRLTVTDYSLTLQKMIATTK